MINENTINENTINENIVNEAMKVLLFDDLGEKATIEEFLGEVVVTIKQDQLLEIANKLHSQRYRFDFLSDQTAIDYETNFVVVYQLRSTTSGQKKLVLRVEIDREETLPSVTSIWRSATWLEREIYDLMGIVFTDHPNLTRILLQDSFEGHPLRKDFIVQSRRK